jgi:hypothetical protein
VSVLAGETAFELVLVFLGGKESKEGQVTRRDNLLVSSGSDTAGGSGEAAKDSKQSNLVETSHRVKKKMLLERETKETLSKDYAVGLGTPK